MPKKKKIRIQLEASNKKGKAKPLAMIVWDGKSQLLELVQRRCKNVRSLRDRESGAELTLSDLLELPDNAIVLGSKLPSTLVEENADLSASQPANSKQVEPQPFRASSVEEGKSILTKHAKERMHQQRISGREVQACIDQGEHMQEGSVDVVRHLDVMAVQAKQSGKVITAMRTTTRTTAVPKERGILLIKCGLVKILRKDLGIKIYYNEEDEEFELTGDSKNKDRAVYRLEHTMNSTDSVIRVPSPHDMCGRIIGRQGQNIKRMKRKLDIDQNIQVAWDANSNMIVLSSPTPFHPDKQAKLFSFVDDIVNGRDPFA